MKYQLITSGRLLAGFKEKKSLARIQRITQLSEEQVRKSLLQGGPKKLLVSDDKEKIQQLALSLRRAGLEVKVQVRRAATEVPAGGPGAITIPRRNEIEMRERERIDFLPRFIAPKKKKSRYRRYLIYLLFFLIILAGTLSMTVETCSFDSCPLAELFTRV